MPIALPPSLPPQSAQHLPVLVAEATRLRSPIPAFIQAGQIDHETACPLKSKCWNPGVQFKTSREQGVGLGQITRVFGRFDALAELRAAHRAELLGWSWDTVHDARYQVRALVLKNGDNYKAIAWQFVDPHKLPPVLTAYNRGIGGVRASRRICQVTSGCDPSKWYGHVERTCAGSKQIIPGTNRTACQISNAYAADVMQRAVKYHKVAP